MVKEPTEASPEAAASSANALSLLGVINIGLGSGRFQSERTVECKVLMHPHWRGLGAVTQRSIFSAAQSNPGLVLGS